MLKVESTFQASAIGSSCYRQTIVKKNEKDSIVETSIVISGENEKQFVIPTQLHSKNLSLFGNKEI